MRIRIVVAATLMAVALTACSVLRPPQETKATAVPAPSPIVVPRQTATTDAGKRDAAQEYKKIQTEYEDIQDKYSIANLETERLQLAVNSAQRRRGEAQDEYRNTPNDSAKREAFFAARRTYNVARTAWLAKRKEYLPLQGQLQAKANELGAAGLDLDIQRHEQQVQKDEAEERDQEKASADAASGNVNAAVANKPEEAKAGDKSKKKPK